MLSPLRHTCTPIRPLTPLSKVLESFKIMDYSLLVGLHNVQRGARRVLVVPCAVLVYVLVDWRAS
jgi:hypothetical protein